MKPSDVALSCERGLESVLTLRVWRGCSPGTVCVAIAEHSFHTNGVVWGAGRAGLPLRGFDPPGGMQE